MAAVPAMLLSSRDSSTKRYDSSLGMSTWAANEAMERSTEAAIFSRVFGRVWTPGMVTAASASRAAISAISTGRTTYMDTPSMQMILRQNQDGPQRSNLRYGPVLSRGDREDQGLSLDQAFHGDAQQTARFSDLFVRDDQGRRQAHHVHAGDQHHQALQLGGFLDVFRAAFIGFADDQAQQQTAAAHGREHLRVIRDQALQHGDGGYAGFLDAGQKGWRVDRFQHFQGYGSGQRVTAIGGAVGGDGQGLRQGFGGQHGADRVAIAQGLGGRQDVWRDAITHVGEQGAGTAHAT